VIPIRTDFRAVYHAPGAYEQVLLPHYFDGLEDTELVAQIMHQHYGRPGNNQSLNVLDLGCGTGRVTAMLAPYAAHLHGVDSGQPMIDVFAQRFPAAEVTCQDTRVAVEALCTKDAGSFDVVGAFWSLSYPIGDLFEDLTVDGVLPKPDQHAAREQAEQLVRRILSLVAPHGHLMILFFDSDTPEQRLVTRLWEKIAPFPGTGRGYAREVVLDTLRAAEDLGDGRLTHTRLGGAALAPDASAARRWFEVVHLKSLPALLADPAARNEIDAFIDSCRQPDGQVVIPAGAHLIDFWKGERRRHLPRKKPAGMP
jgi:SAM-dependent methyltransferase